MKRTLGLILLLLASCPSMGVSHEQLAQEAGFLSADIAAATVLVDDEKARGYMETVSELLLLFSETEEGAFAEDDLAALKVALALAQEYAVAEDDETLQVALLLIGGAVRRMEAQ